MSNPVLSFLKTLEGKELKDSPSPVTVWLKSRLIGVDEGKALVEYHIRKEMTNPLGTLQGGILTAMMDDALGVAVYSLGKDRLYTTVNFAVDFLESVTENDLVLISAEIVRAGSTIVNVKIRAKDESGKLLANATSNLVVKHIEGLKLPRYKGLEEKYPGVTFDG